MGPSVTATQHCVGSMGQDSSKHTWQGTLIPTTERNPQKLPVLGGTTASTSSPILGGATVHGPTLPVDGSTPTAVRQSLVGRGSWPPPLVSLPLLCAQERLTGPPGHQSLQQSVQAHQPIQLQDWHPARL